MSTNSTITVITEKDKEAKRIYCHWDGYPSWVGAMLLEHYNSFEKAKALVELGDISSLRERLAPKPGEQHSFEKPLEDVTIFYGRDRGETGVEPVVDHPDIIFFPSKSILREYNYMFDGEKWLLRPKNAKQWQELTRKICDLPELEETKILSNEQIVEYLFSDLGSYQENIKEMLIARLKEDTNTRTYWDAWFRGATGKDLEAADYGKVYHKK